jgi:hypothetical protein
MMQKCDEIRNAGARLADARQTLMKLIDLCQQAKPLIKKISEIEHDYYGQTSMSQVVGELEIIIQHTKRELPGF